MRDAGDAVTQHRKPALNPRCSRVLGQKIEVAEEPRDGRAQLMGGVSYELALCARRFPPIHTSRSVLSMRMKSMSQVLVRMK